MQRFAFRNQFLIKQYNKQLNFDSFKYFSSGNTPQQAHKKIEILISETNDINFNLATEEFLYEHQDLKHPVLFLYRNNKTIVIGRHQNPWKECYLQNMERDGINLARRKTGGGAVYQDLGNSVFSFLYPSTDESFPLDVSKKINNSILIKSLKNLGIDAEVSGRNDMLCNGKKISGSAYKVNLGNKQGQGRKALHHGTMLLNLQSQDLQKYLNPNKAKLKSKGVDSVISRVMNLVEINPEINHEIFCEEVKKEFKAFYCNAEVSEKILDKSELDKNEIINDIYQKSISWEWLHGQTPKFSNSIDTRFDWGIIDFNFEVHNSLIIEAQMQSDCLFADFISDINTVLEQNQQKYLYDMKGMQQFCQDIRKQIADKPQYMQYVDDLEKWIVEAI